MLGFADVMLAGLARDGGLYVPESWPRLAGETILGFAHTIAGHPVEIISGVRETLEYLAVRHRLILLTKGNLT